MMVCSWMTSDVIDAEGAAIYYNLIRVNDIQILHGAWLCYS